MLCSAAEIAGGLTSEPGSSQSARWSSDRLTPMTALAIGTILIDQRKASWYAKQKRLSLREEKLRARVAALAVMKELHEKNLVSDLELKNSEQAVTDLQTLIARDRASSALDKAAAMRIEGKEPTKPSAPAERKVSRARPIRIRYDGAADWTIEDAEKIKVFFRERFGRELPVSAFGQSPTHDRLGLDHSDAIDVAIRPDSAEGRALMAFLRSAGIPFTAFRGRISRASTGPHIHIGPPSPRLLLADRPADDPKTPQAQPESG